MRQIAIRLVGVGDGVKVWVEDGTTNSEVKERCLEALDRYLAGVAVEVTEVTGQATFELELTGRPEDEQG